METLALEQKEVRPKAATTKELAILYNIPERSLRSWIEKIEHLLGPKNGHYYTPKQVGIMYREWGAPVLLYYPVVFLAAIVWIWYKMVFTVESLIRRFFCYRDRSTGSESTTQDILLISVATIQFCIAVLSLVIAGYYVVRMVLS